MAMRKATLLCVLIVSACGSAGGCGGGVPAKPAQPAQRPQSARTSVDSATVSEPNNIVIKWPATGACAKATNLAELKSALRAGKCITIAGAINFHSPADAINLSALVPAGVSEIAWESAGDWTGQFNRLASFPEPLVYATHDRDWSFRWRGLKFDGFFNSGPAFDLCHVQLSIFEDVRVQRFGGNWPWRMGSCGATSATELRDVMMFLNEKPAYVLNASDVRIRGGANEVGDWKRGWTSGLVVVGQPHDPPRSVGGPVLIEDPHMEGSTLVVDKVVGFTFRGGYCFVCEIRVTNTAPTAIACNGTYAQGGNLKVNGSVVCH